MLLFSIVLWTAAQSGLKKPIWIDPLRDDLLQRVETLDRNRRLLVHETRMEFNECTRISSSDWTSSDIPEKAGTSGLASRVRKVTSSPDTAKSGSDQNSQSKGVVILEQKCTVDPIPHWSNQSVICFWIEVFSRVEETIQDRQLRTTRLKLPPTQIGWRGCTLARDGFYDPARDYAVQPKSFKGNETPHWITKQKIDAQILAPVAEEVLSLSQKAGQNAVNGVNHVVDLASLSWDSKSRILVAYDPILTGEDRSQRYSPLQVRVLVFKHVRITDPTGAQITIRVPGAETQRGAGEAPTLDLTELAQTLLNPKEVSIRSLNGRAKAALEALIAGGEKIWCGAKVMKGVPTPSELEECSLTITEDASVSIRYDTRSFTYPVSLSPRPGK